MWPFKRAPTPAPPLSEPSALAQLAALAAELRQFQAELSQLRLEWQETLDKITAWANRQAARDRRAIGKALEAPLGPDLVPADHPDAPPSPHAAKEALRRRVFKGA